MLTVRLIDRITVTEGDIPQTTQDLPFRVTVPCATTAATTIGSTCSVGTTADALMPGAVPEGRRSIWQLGQIQLNDSGADGNIATTGDNRAVPRGRGSLSRSRIASAVAACLTICGAVAAEVSSGQRASPRTSAGQLSRVTTPLLNPTTRRAKRELERSLGREGVVQLDRSGAVRRIARLDGYLHARRVRICRARSSATTWTATGGCSTPSPRPSTTCASPVVGIPAARSLGCSSRQTYKGLPVIGAEVTANVTEGGRLVNIAGALEPVPDVASVTPTINRFEALQAAEAALGGARPLTTGLARTSDALRPRFRTREQAKLVVAKHGGTYRLTWRVLLYSREGELFDAFVDARTGDPLRFRSLTRDALATVFDHYPGAPVGGTQQTVDITNYLYPGATTLEGPWAFVWADYNDDDSWELDEQTPTNDGTNFQYPYQAFNYAGGACRPSPYFCSWNHTNAFSWHWSESSNLDRNSTQIFWFVNRYQQHLRASPIEFTPQKGSFQAPYEVYANSHDGANANAGLPDTAHANNANMSTPAYGAPLMQMYLFQPGVSGFSAVNGGDDASWVLHEYTHGLTSRTVTDPDGVDATFGHQGDSLHEGMSDWYALDYITKQGLMTDTATNGEIKWGQYASLTNGEPRSQGYDCAVGAAAAQCPGAGTAGSGGYTYGDMGGIQGFPESHADGEIWAETLWDLRRRLIADRGATEGVRRAELLVTGGMELAPEAPSFVDMRDAILQADTAFNGGADHAAVWSVFAARGMGYFASAIDATDRQPVENFSTPPAPSGTGTLSGTVVTEQGVPVHGASVYVGGHTSGLPDDLYGE